MKWDTELRGEVRVKRIWFVTVIAMLAVGPLVTAQMA
jgi:hypothetical protein